MTMDAILLPGIVMPKELAYRALIHALSKGIRAHAKDLEVYATERPPAGYGLELEVDAVLRDADAAGFERFHVVGYSGGGAIAAVLAARHPDRLLSMALLEPAWMGNRGMSPEERRATNEIHRLRDLPPDELMPQFMRLQLAPGVEPPPRPDGPPPPWMAKRPAGIRALTSAFERYDLDPGALRAFERPVYFALGARSRPDYFGKMAERAGALFPDYTLEVFEGRHHFDPPHRVEPERLAARLEGLWDRATR
jgi:pimeloyl-ACP methyl ester carboxylesterase